MKTGRQTIQWAGGTAEVVAEFQCARNGYESKVVLHCGKVTETPGVWSGYLVCSKLESDNGEPVYFGGVMADSLESAHQMAALQAGFSLTPINFGN